MNLGLWWKFQATVQLIALHFRFMKQIFFKSLLFKVKSEWGTPRVLRNPHRCKTLASMLAKQTEGPYIGDFQRRQQNKYL